MAQIVYNSGSQNVYNYGGGYIAYQFRLEVVVDTQSTENNTSKVIVNTYANATKASYSSSSGKYGYVDFWSPTSAITVNGSLKKTETVSHIDSLSERVISTWSGDFTHNADGNLSITVSTAYNPNTTSYNYLPKSNTISATVSLPKILRNHHVYAYDGSSWKEGTLYGFDGTTWRKGNISTGGVWALDGTTWRKGSKRGA